MFIGEIGINHNGNLDTALKLIDEAKRCGVDVVKFQKRDPNVCVPDHQKNVRRIWKGREMTYLEYKYDVEFWHQGASLHSGFQGTHHGLSGVPGGRSPLRLPAQILPRKRQRTLRPGRIGSPGTV